MSLLQQLFQSATKSNLHNVMCKEIGIKMLTVASKLENKQVYLRLNSKAGPTDAVANNVKYHQHWIYL